MLGVFPKDIWCLLFNEFIDYRSILTLRMVSKKMHSYMTPEQQQLIEIVSATNIDYTNNIRKSLKAVKQRHKTVMLDLEKRQRGMCSCCFKIMKLSLLSKHQRQCSRALKLEEKRDVCLDCGITNPYYFGHMLGKCPFIGSKQCPDCGVNEPIQNGYIHPHQCLMTPIKCRFCSQMIPSAIAAFHKCSKQCIKKIYGGMHQCSGKRIAGSKFCRRHSSPVCCVVTKAGHVCTRAVKVGEKMCGQHFKMWTAGRLKSI